MKGQGSSNSGGLQCSVPTKSNVIGFPEPFLAFHEWGLMETFHNLLLKVFITVIKAVFVFLGFSGKGEYAKVL